MVLRLARVDERLRWSAFPDVAHQDSDGRRLTIHGSPDAAWPDFADSDADATSVYLHEFGIGGRHPF